MRQLLYFTAPWCASCKQIKPLVEKVNVPVQIHDVDTAEGRAVAFQYDVQALPTVIVIDDDQVAWGMSGMTRDLVMKLQELQWAS